MNLLRDIIILKKFPQEERMTTIDLTIDKSRRKNAMKRAKERNIVIPHMRR